MKARSYRKKSSKELEKELQDLEKGLVKSYGVMSMATVKSNKEGTKVKGSNVSRRIKKEIARVKTILREKELEI